MVCSLSIPQNDFCSPREVLWQVFAVVILVLVRRLGSQVIGCKFRAGIGNSWKEISKENVICMIIIHEYTQKCDMRHIYKIAFTQLRNSPRSTCSLPRKLPLLVQTVPLVHMTRSSAMGITSSLSGTDSTRPLTPLIIIFSLAASALR